AVDVDHLVDTKEVRHLHTSLRELLERAPVLAVGLLQCRLKTLPPRRVGDRRDDKRLAIGTDLKWRIRLNVQQVENRPVDDKCVTVAVFGKRLDHGGLQKRHSIVSTSDIRRQRSTGSI